LQTGSVPDQVPFALQVNGLEPDIIPKPGLQVKLALEPATGRPSMFAVFSVTTPFGKDVPVNGAHVAKRKASLLFKCHERFYLTIIIRYIQCTFRNVSIL